ncbi:Hemerythrin-like [Quillaja saponaria]|uniref:Hemerythrin-like n=1 Tax=Quillaja saponaria TaxID=32244 RepID=A0AAD7PW96_QUISA|nr:Hemerythrin-like [Quillaja saponaria]
MGNCLGKSDKLTAEIVPHDGTYPTVRLYGSPTNIVTAYIRFALLHKAVSPDFVPSSQTTRFGGSEPENPVVLQVGSETVSGSRETLLQYIDNRFPNPPLTTTAGSREVEEETTPLIVKMTRLQHKSMTWHLERMVRWADDLAARGGRKAVDPALGSPRMEVKKFAKSYSQLLEVMLEHAQMEERVIFPILDMADRGLCKAANEEHARDLPVMNGIKEAIKSIGVLDSGSPACQEAIFNLVARLKSLQEQCKQHFMEEEMNILPFMEAVDLSNEQHKRTLEHCFDVMQETHSRLFSFLLEGLVPHDAMQYLDLISRCREKEQLVSIVHAYLSC